MMEQIQRLNSVLNALNFVETHGKQSIDALLASIQTVEKVRDALIQMMKEREPDA